MLILSDVATVPHCSYLPLKEPFNNFHYSNDFKDRDHFVIDLSSLDLTWFFYSYFCSLLRTIGYNLNYIVTF